MVTIVLLFIWVCGEEPVLEYTEFTQSYEPHGNVLSLCINFGEKSNL